MPTESPNAGSTTNALHAVFREDLDYLRRLFAFLEASYRGGARYKKAVDPDGNPVLIQHENEVPHSQAKDLRSSAGQPTSTTKRFERRQQLSPYENHVRPIVDSYAAYVLQNPPARDATLKEELERVKLDALMRQVLRMGLRLTEIWVGFDAKPIAELSQKEKPTQQDAEAVDPVHKGKRYPIIVHPSRVVDAQFDGEGNAVRVVIEEEAVTKESLTAPPVKTTRYREWTATNWTLYKVVENTNAPGVVVTGGPKLELEKSGAHQFGRCPYARFAPNFAIEDICDLSKVLFNMNSLLNEELYKNTFTQAVFTGTTTDEIKQVIRDSGAAIALPNPQARVGTLGADTGQAESIRTRMDDLRDAIYDIACMDSLGVKNVAESAEKKRRDTENLHTVLKGIAEDLQRVENWLIEGLKLGSNPASPDVATFVPTKYSTEFDVLAFTELLAQFREIVALPFMPAEFKKKQAERIRQKIDPFGDHEKLSKQVDEMIDTSSDLISAITMLNRDLGLPVELVAAMLAVPASQRSAFLAAAGTHRDPFAAPHDQGGIDAQGDGTGDGTGGGTNTGDRNAGIRTAPGSPDGGAGSAGSGDPKAP